MRVAYFLMPGGHRTEVSASHTGDGVYEASLTLAESGAYYIYVAAPSAKVNFGDLPYMTLRAGAAGDDSGIRRGAVKPSRTTQPVSTDQPQ